MVVGFTNGRGRIRMGVGFTRPNPTTYGDHDHDGSLYNFQKNDLYI